MKGSIPRLSTAGTCRHIVLYLLLYIAGALVGSTVFGLLAGAAPASVKWLFDALEGLGVLAISGLLLWAYTARALRLRLRDFGITAALKGWAVVCAAALPLAVAGVYLAIGRLSVADGLTGRAVAERVSISAAFALESGILEEMLFRGFILRLAEQRWGKTAAILAPSLLFACLHLPGMSSFSVPGVLMLLVSGTLVGVMFSLVADRSGSVSNSAIVHVLWNFALVMSILHINTPQGGYGTPMLTITIPAEPLWLTGGDFGVEASVVSMIGYAVVCLVALAAGKGRKTAADRG